MQPAQLEAALELPEVPPDTLEEPPLALLEEATAEDPPGDELEPPPLETREELPGLEDTMEEDAASDDETGPEPDPAEVVLAPEEAEEAPLLEDDDGSGPPVVDGTHAAPDAAASAATGNTPRTNLLLGRIWCLLRGIPCGAPWPAGVKPARALSAVQHASWCNKALCWFSSFSDVARSNAAGPPDDRPPPATS